MYLNDHGEVVSRNSTLIILPHFNCISCSLVMYFFSTSNFSVLTFYSVLLVISLFTLFMGSDTPNKTRFHVIDSLRDGNCQLCCPTSSCTESHDLPTKAICLGNHSLNCSGVDTVSWRDLFNVSLAVSVSPLQASAGKLHVEESVNIFPDCNFGAKIFYSQCFTLRSAMKMRVQ